MPKALALILGIGLCGAIVVGVGCGEDEPSESIQVVTTTELVADWVRQIGGDHVEVSALIPTGADPHTFEPSPRDVALVSQADIAFASGLGLETSTLDLIEANMPAGAALVKLGDETSARGFELIDEDGDAEDRTGVNPHLWLDPVAVQIYLTVIEEQLLILAPGAERDFQQNREEYLEELDAAVAYLAGKVTEVSLDQRVLVTTHDAFPYFARAIGFEVGAFVAAGPGQEPTPRVVAELAQVIDEHQLKAVFREPQVGPETAILEQAAQDTGVEVCVLLSDTFSGEAESYIELVRRNGDELARCLGG
jgi:ABC-type Zn uptake system ZnuABC Zn-binding protein ZnuA